MTHERALLVNVNTRIANYFWKIIDVLSCKIKKIAEMYEKSIGKEYVKENMIFETSSAKNILHIGCGAYPITAMTLAKINNVNIVGIDKDLKFIKLARNIVKGKNLETKIRIEQGDGTNYPLKEFDTIIISGCSYPRKQILEHAFENANPGSKIIFRTSIQPAKSIIDCMNSHKDIAVLKNIKNYPFLFGKVFGWRSFYLIKN